jgi:hypothetical protein
VLEPDYYFVWSDYEEGIVAILSVYQTQSGDGRPERRNLKRIPTAAIWSREANFSGPMGSIPTKNTFAILVTM